MDKIWKQIIGVLLVSPLTRGKIFHHASMETDIPPQPAWILEKAQEIHFDYPDWNNNNLLQLAPDCQSEENLSAFLLECVEEYEQMGDQSISIDMLFKRLKPTPQGPYVYNGQRARDLADLPPPEAVVGGLLHRGHVTVMSAPPYSGKSWFALNVASAVASVSQNKPAPWPGALLDCPGTKTVYISPDFPASELARRLRRLDEQRRDLVQPDSYWDNLFLVGDAPGVRMPRGRYAIDQEGSERIMNELVPEGTSLIVIDTLSASLPYDVTENDNGGMAKVMGNIQAIASEKNVAVLLIHHTAKPTAGKGSSEVWSSVRGAGAISGSASSNCLIEQLPNDQYPNIRRLRTVSNVSSSMPTTYFEVRPAYLTTDEILYFRPVPDPTLIEGEE